MATNNEDNIQLSLITCGINESQAMNMSIAQWIIVLENEGLNYEIIVIDNGSTDNVHFLNYESFQKTHNNFPIRFERYDKIRGTLPVKAYGVSLAKGKYLIFPDCHQFFKPNSFKTSLGILEQNPEIKVVCMLGNIDGISKGGDKIRAGLENLDGDWIYALETQDSFPIFWGAGGGMIISKEWFHEIGGFFPDIFEKIEGSYAVEEYFMSVLTWMFGKKVFCNSQGVFYHIKYRYHSNDGYRKDFQNSLNAFFYIIQGNQRNYNQFVEKHWSGQDKDMVENFIPKIAEEARKYVASKTKYSYPYLNEHWDEIKNL